MPMIHLKIVIITTSTAIIKDNVSLCSPAWPRACYVDQAGPKLKDPPASNSQVLGLNVYVTISGSQISFGRCFFLILRLLVDSFSLFQLLKVTSPCPEESRRSSCWATFPFAILKAFLLVLFVTILISMSLGVSLLFGGCSAS